MNFLNWPHDYAELAPLLRLWGIQASRQLEWKCIPEGLSGTKIWCISHAEHNYCLRRWSAQHPRTTQLRTIHHGIEHIWQAGLKIVPVPHKSLHGDSFVTHEGHLWELSPWLSGKPLTRDCSIELRRAAVEALAAFHLSAAAFARTSNAPICKPAPGLIRRREILERLLKNHHVELSQAVRSEPHSAIKVIQLQLLAQMEHKLPSAFVTVEKCAKTPLPLQWCLRDVHPGNLLETNQQITGIVDFGAADFDSVAGDIARLLGGFEWDPTEFDQCLRVYTNLRAISSEEQRAIAAYHLGGLIAAAGNWMRWISVERSARLDNTTQLRLEELLLQFERIDHWNM